MAARRAGIITCAAIAAAILCFRSGSEPPRGAGVRAGENTARAAVGAEHGEERRRTALRTDSSSVSSRPAPARPRPRLFFHATWIDVEIARLQSLALMGEEEEPRLRALLLSCAPPPTAGDLPPDVRNALRAALGEERAQSYEIARAASVERSAVDRLAAKLLSRLPPLEESPEYGAAAAALSQAALSAGSLDEFRESSFSLAAALPEAVRSRLEETLAEEPSERLVLGVELREVDDAARERRLLQYRALLGLSEEQIQDWRELLISGADEVKQRLAGGAPDDPPALLRDMQVRLDDRLRALLTPEQFSRYEEYRSWRPGLKTMGAG